MSDEAKTKNQKLRAISVASGASARVIVAELQIERGKQRAECVQAP